jgi:hypothetical protein
MHPSSGYMIWLALGQRPAEPPVESEAWWRRRARDAGRRRRTRQPKAGTSAERTVEASPQRLRLVSGTGSSADQGAERWERERSRA